MVYRYIIILFELFEIQLLINVTSRYLTHATSTPKPNLFLATWTPPEPVLVALLWPLSRIIPGNVTRVIEIIEISILDRVADDQIIHWPPGAG